MNENDQPIFVTQPELTDEQEELYELLAEMRI